MIPVYGQFAVEDINTKIAVRNNEICRKVNAMISKHLNSINFHKIVDLNLNHSYGKSLPKEIIVKLQQLLSNFANNRPKTYQIPFDDLEMLQQDFNQVSKLFERNKQEEQKDSFGVHHEIELGLAAIKEYFFVKFLISSIDNPSDNNILPINNLYIETFNYLNSSIISLLNLCELPYYQDYRVFWLDLCNYINAMESPNDFKEILNYLNGGYKHLAAMHKVISNLTQRIQLESIKSIECIKINSLKDDIQSIDVYNGPPFLKIISSTIFTSEYGAFKTIPLCDIEIWKHSLQQQCDIIWSNSALETPTHYTLQTNYIKAQKNAKRLLLEVNYIEMLCHNQNDVSVTPFTRNFHNLTNKLKDYIVESISYANSSLESQEVLYKTSLTNALIGCVELCLITFTPLIDPVEKNRLKSTYIADDVCCLNYLKLAYDFTRITMKYKHMGEEIYEAINERLDVLKESQSKHKEKVALRPDQCLYSSLVKDINHFLTTNCNPEMVMTLVNNVESVWTHLFDQHSFEHVQQQLESCTEVISKLNLWISNSQKFVHHTLKRYSTYYQDFILPLQCSIDQLRFGFEGLTTVLSQIKNSFIVNNNGTYTNINVNNRLHCVLQNVGEFPSSKMLNIFNINSSKDIVQNRCPVFSILNRTPGCETDYFHLLKAKLFELKNQTNISSRINQELFEEFNFTFNIINQVWQQEEELRRQKQKEDESLYQTKTKCEEENEEDQELREINELFPTSIEDDFADFMQEDTLEKVMKLNKKKETNTKNLSIIVQENDYTFIAKMFTDILVKHTKSYYHTTYHRSSNNKFNVELVEYFKEKIGVFVKLFNFYRSSVNDWLDIKCFNSLYFCLVLQRSMLSENFKLDYEEEKPYNFYKDANVQEIMSCVNVLNIIEDKVNKQLELYPEHATLIDINKVIARIRLLPVTSPVVRFNTGFQILRQHIALWNEVAHKNNNLKPEEQEIAQYVQKWTRLELQFWRTCLTQTSDKVEAKTYKYWFFIYNLINEFINERKIDFSLFDMKQTMKRFYNHETVEPDTENMKSFKVEINDILTILRQFVESSCYGDFSVRMQLLLSFELYLQNLAAYTTEIKEEFTNEIWQLIAGLRNLQLYFEQFSKDIEEHKKTIKQPIEKKIKELVKIESYNKDLSYISMRNNVARVHRNLNKYLKEYEQLLREKITAVFQPKDCTIKDFNFANDKGIDLRYDSKIKYFMVDLKYFVLSTKQHRNQQDLIENNLINDQVSQNLLSKVQRLFYTARNVVKETIGNVHYSKNIIALDNMLTLQLERCDQLRNLTVDRTKERAKQKLEAKQILQQKRKGLTDLFKALSTLGINYKTGLMELSMNNEFEDMLLPPFCVKNMLYHHSKDKRLQPKILQLNENLDLYFNKCIFKLKLLRNIMLTPLAELGPPNIERIKGYAVDLFLLVQNQRKLLSSTTKNIYDFRVLLQQLRGLEDINSKEHTDESYFDFNNLRDRCQILITILTRIIYVFEQLKLFLSNVNTNCQSENILFANNDHMNDISLDRSSILTECETILSESKSILNTINKENCEFILKDKVNHYMHAYSKLNASIVNILKHFETSKKEYLPIANPLLDLSTYMNESMQSALSDVANENSNSSFENFEETLESIIHSVLISLQKLFKKYPTKNSQDEDEKISPKKKTSEDDSELEDQHLKKRLYESLKDDWNVMNMDKLNKEIMNMLLVVKLAAPSVEKIENIKKLLNIQPLLEQFNLMTEYFLYQQLGAHKVSAKMLSVLLTVFIEIGTKGFCVPQDLMQDEEGESKKDQKEGEGFGLEDGTGENDASDKIESEDQLDDAKRPEDRAEDNKKDEKDNECKEEKGIEMSDNFEGELQDIEKPEDENDDSGESENEEDMSKEMGETEEGAEKLDDQIWGDDEQPEEPEEENDMNEEDGKGNQDEQDSHNDLDSKNEAPKDDGKSDLENNGLDATNEQNDEGKQKNQDKTMDDMKDQEEDQDQVNPYHNELEEPNEPEDFDLGDLNVNDDNEDDEANNNEDNPFDIDTMKDNMPNDMDDAPENEQNDGSDAEENKEENNAASSDESDDDDQSNLKNDTENADEEKPNEEDKKDDSNDVDEQKRGEYNEDNVDEEDKENANEKHEEYEQSKDKPSNEENMQTVPEMETKGSNDQLEAEQSKSDVQQDQSLDEQNTGEENEGVGQAENEVTIVLT